ncbi:hypothetical protein CHUAL_003532 [Chamberlinius hualienensis]
MLHVAVTAILTLALVSGNDNEPLVQTKSGVIRGFIGKSLENNIYYGFKGIPYALPPTESLRFKPPVPFNSWTDIRDGSISGNKCPQIDITTKQYVGDEDCLYLNVYVQKHLNWPELLPVLVLIHGGAFIYESGDFVDYGPQIFMAFPIVVVTFNYRLGALGFLSTNDSSAYGNYGLWDQLLALQWIQQNIEQFGGDKNKVTLMGQSAGAASVIYHLISDQSKGLFSRAIAMSGTAISYWAFQKNPAEVAEAFATRLGCHYTTTQAIVECLRKKSALELVTNTNPTFPLQFLPTVDGFCSGMIKEHPLQSLQNGHVVNKVPLIMGRDLNEGYLMFLVLQFGLNPNITGSEYFEKYFPYQLSTISNVSMNMTSVINAIEDNYYRNSGVNIDDPNVFRDVLQNITGDVGFHADIAYTIELLSKTGLPVYPYIYDYIGEFDYSIFFNGISGLYPSHGNELFLLWQHLFNYTLNEKDYAVAKVFSKLLTDFVIER